MKLLTLVLASASLWAASALCPNSCSGNGFCNEVDRCVCFSRVGTKSGEKMSYTGADCSQRVCPFAPAHDAIATKTQSNSDFEFEGRVGLVGASATSEERLNVMVANRLPQKRDLNVEVEVIAATYGGTPTVTWRYKFTDHQRYFGTPLVATSGAAASAPEEAAQLLLGGADTGVFVWWDMAGIASSNVQVTDRYFFNVTWHDNSHFVASDPDTAHQAAECAGRGACDRATGLCKCDAGFEGEACQRRSCPSGCSGHGVCLTLKRAAGEALDDPTAYNSAWDSDVSTTCQCDDGYRGPDCSKQECPSGPDPLGGFGGDGVDALGATGPAMDCSGRGICNYDTGLCKCAKGFYGEACEKQTNFV
jgi:hypothetical protein